MRVTNPASGRPAYYDRNPSAVAAVYQTAGVGPHTVTTRWTYTVPTGRKAYIGAGQIDVYRATVAAPVGKTEASISVGGEFLSVTSANNAVGNSGHVTIGSGAIALAGVVISAQTTDASTGGTNDYEITAMIMEFDA